MTLRPASHAPFRLGIAGGLGSGKTALADALARRGVPVFVADAEAKRLMNDDARLRSALVDAFGPGTYCEDGTLDRVGLAARVFGDADALARLNALVHPFVFQAWQRFVADRAGAPLVAHESAILFESGGDEHVDAVVWVDAPRETRIARALARDPRLTRDDIEVRMAHQIDPAFARARASVVVDNTGALDALEAVADALVEQFAQTR